MLKSWKLQLRGSARNGFCILIGESRVGPTSRRCCGAMLVLRASACRSKFLKSRVRFNVDVTGARLRASGGQQGSAAPEPSSGD